MEPMDILFVEDFEEGNSKSWILDEDSTKSWLCEEEEPKSFILQAFPHTKQSAAFNLISLLLQRKGTHNLPFHCPIDFISELSIFI